jgi:hypothetical protein
MPTRYDTTPPWGKKRKREVSSSPPEPSTPDRKQVKLSVTTTLRTRSTMPWDQDNGSSPLALTPSHTKNSTLDQAVTDIFNSIRADLPLEEILGCMEHIVTLCQDEPPGCRNWLKVVAKYKSLGASQEDVDVLEQEREPMWTQRRVRLLSNTLATPEALADSMQTMLETSEESHGDFLDPKVKHQLIQTIHQVRASVPRVPLASHASDDRNESPAPMAQMAMNKETLKSAQVTPTNHVVASLDPRRKSRPAGWSPNSRVTESDPALSLPASAPKRLVKDLHSPNPPSPSLSPKTSAPLIQFRIPAASNHAPLRRTRPGVDVSTARTSIDTVSTSNPSASSSERRRSSVLEPPTAPLPTGPRKTPLFQAKISAQLGKTILSSKIEVLHACDDSNMCAQDATFYKMKSRYWLLHFRDCQHLYSALGKTIMLRGFPVRVLRHAPDESFQVYGASVPAHMDTLEGEIDTINVIARSFSIRPFVLHRSKHLYDNRRTLKWLLVFDRPMQCDLLTFDVFATASRRRETLDFSGLSSGREVCWVCLESGHNAASCDLTELIELPHEDRRYLTCTPRLE